MIAHYGAVPASMRAIVAVIDGELMGIAGLRYTPYGLVAFSELKPGMEKYPVSIMKGGRMLVKMIRESDAPVYAVGRLPTAPAFLQRLGFKPAQNEGTFVWEH